ncbi:MAG: hypothetical protein Q9208_006858 [Pyrenodesmia sp. 3 TL-2023]
MTHTLLSLPSETLISVASHLNTAADYIHLSLTCKSIERVLDDEHVVGVTLKVAVPCYQSPYSREHELVTSRSLSAREALQKLYDRQQAFAASKPSSVIVIGNGSSFLYRQGWLAYVRAGTIRILDVHNARKTEGVLLSQHIGPQALDIRCDSTEFELYNLQDGLLTFMFHGETEAVGWQSWILVVDIDNYTGNDQEPDRMRLVVDLWTPEEIVVRNDKRYVCIMTPTGTSVNGRHREWVCRVWVLSAPESRPMTLQIPDLAIGEIGQTLIFEIFNESLYAVSTQSPFEMDEPEWTSFYTCFRFPLENPHPLTLEKLRIWRRHHKEGPINDLWTDLKLHRDEATGKLFVIEARKEWTGGSSAQSRTWYRQELPSRFPTPRGAVDDVEMADATNSDANVQQASATNLASSSDSAQDPPYLLATPPKDNESDLDTASTTVTLERRPGYPRIPHKTHLEYAADAPRSRIVDGFILAKSKYRSYNPSAAAFLDLVVDDRQQSTQSVWAQQIRLRVGSRGKASPIDDSGMMHKRCTDSHTGQPVPDSELRYVDQGIHLWPPNDAPAVLQDLLNGKNISHYRMSSDEAVCKTLGDITAVSDERSIVYLVKEKGAHEDHQGQLILINFDEHIHFLYRKWVPEFIDLYGRQDLDLRSASTEAADPVTMEGMPEQKYEPMEIDDDEADEEDGEEQEETDKENTSESDDEDKFMPANDINDHFWCELYDDDEPVEAEWFVEEMAHWTDIQEGFCFV